MRGRGDLLRIVARLTLGGVFLYAGLVKISEPAGFAGSVAAYRLFPYFGNYLVAAVLPWLEALCGLLLIAGYRTRAAASLVLLLILVFMAALVSALARGLDIDCGCFRHGGEKSTALSALARDGILLVMALVVLRSAGRRFLRFSGK